MIIPKCFSPSQMTALIWILMMETTVLVVSFGVVLRLKEKITKLNQKFARSNLYLCHRAQVETIRGLRHLFHREGSLNLQTALVIVNAWEKVCTDLLDKKVKELEEKGK